ncbi:hydantoinase B/oxoprolinase family protein [Methylobacterium sp. J-030]|uniref:hydantoinase B/oxoprolinase family protein n=1 Tax=Methylobacterium sp. J-030 TaxID=2836627 RepID=UPI001FBB3E25|nr:hydantoinase B/oxoprolinase family protein [Methylobacterium sp. J-030]MCJ2073364.1 hydantoinase B/oxoprolinase family protein [Methylobacterium sp. J-030]
MALDKILLEILGNRFTGVVEEMGYIIHRSAFTTFVKETWDFDSALVTRDGDVFAYPRSIGVTNMLSMNLKAAIDCFDSYEPGDVVLTNDPNHARGMATHLPDLMTFRPIFAEGRLICFAWCFVHSSDVGGIVPGSITPHATDRFQEGVVIPPIKLYKAGVLDEELKRFVLANGRIPDQNWGDINALTAALRTAERRVGECIARYGAGEIERVIEGLLHYAEMRARQVFAAVPDGRYAFSDYLEGDLLKTNHVRIKLALTVTDSDVHLDFTGTDPQVNAAFNLPTHGMLNQFIVLGIVNFLRTSDPEIPFNRGMVRPVTVTLPDGCILNPTRYAPTGIRYTTALRISDVVMGALSQAVPSRIPAAGSGQFGLLTLSDLEPKTGSYVVHVLQPLQGGSGGRPGKDGIDGVNFSGGALRNAPVEALEIDAPIFVRRYELNDAVAPGKWRGGSGIVFECQILSAHAQISSRGWDRFLFNPWGREGGAGGTLGATFVVDRDGRERPIPKIDVLKLAPGETVRIVSPGGGGYGDALDRDPAAVLRDVQDGFVTAEDARTDYGVVLRGDAVDAAASQALRAAEGRRELVDFEFGAARRAYQTMLPEAFQDLVVRILESEPAGSRLYLRDIIYSRAQESGLEGLDDAGLRQILADLAHNSRRPSLGRARTRTVRS